ncbi:MAG: FAD-dependent oxidoreductase [Proteobacteria bacterium]|nr:FAD-dependent oxidoreductase [Pseudomonadota bacterium]
MRVAVLGAGVAGLTCALELRAAGAEVELHERSPEHAVRGCSWYAGGMLAPWCEAENSGELVAALGQEGLPWWRARVPAAAWGGTLLVAHPRDRAELAQFGRRTARFEVLGAQRVGVLEPELAGRFADGLYFPDEGHLDARAALDTLRTQAAGAGVTLRFGSEGPAAGAVAVRVDCTGFAARHSLPQLRGVKGEMVLLRHPELSFTRPVRLLHPRLPVYVVPRGEGTYLVGATMIESEEGTRVSARSLLELLSAAYALHPAFGEAEVLEAGTAVRPAFPDNQPRLEWRGSTLFVNGLYRHGFLLAPALARRAAQAVLDGRHFPEVMDANPAQRRLA